MKEEETINFRGSKLTLCHIWRARKINQMSRILQLCLNANLASSMLVSSNWTKDNPLIHPNLKFQLSLVLDRKLNLFLLELQRLRYPQHLEQQLRMIPNEMAKSKFQLLLELLQLAIKQQLQQKVRRSFRAIHQWSQKLPRLWREKWLKTQIQQQILKDNQRKLRSLLLLEQLWPKM